MILRGLSGIDTGIQTSQKKPAEGHKAATEAEIKQSLNTGLVSETATLLNNTAGDRSPIRFVADDPSRLIQVVSRSTGESLMNVYTGQDSQILATDPENAAGNLALRGADAVKMRPFLPAMLLDIATRIPDNGEQPREVVGFAFVNQTEMAGIKETVEPAGRMRPAAGMGLGT